MVITSLLVGRSGWFTIYRKSAAQVQKLAQDESSKGELNASTIYDNKID